MKTFNEFLEERKAQYENLINTDTTQISDMSEEDKKLYLHELEVAKKDALEKLNNPNQLEEAIKKDIIFNAVKFIGSIKYVNENSLDLQELINKAPRFFVSSNDLSKTEKAVLLGFVLGQSTFEFESKDYKELGGYTNPEFLKNLVRKIKSEYNVVIPLTDEFLTINKNSSKGK